MPTTLAPVPAATPRKPCPCPTYYAVAILPEGAGYLLLVAGLRLTEVMAWRAPDGVLYEWYEGEPPEALRTT